MGQWLSDAYKAYIHLMQEDELWAVTKGVNPLVLESLMQFVYVNKPAIRATNKTVVTASTHGRRTVKKIVYNIPHKSKTTVPVPTSTQHIPTKTNKEATIWLHAELFFFLLRNE